MLCFLLALKVQGLHVHAVFSKKLIVFTCILYFPESLRCSRACCVFRKAQGVHLHVLFASLNFNSEDGISMACVLSSIQCKYLGLYMYALSASLGAKI
jgi:hypothetical protein